MRSGSRKKTPWHALLPAACAALLMTAGCAHRPLVIAQAGDAALEGFAPPGDEIVAPILEAAPETEEDLLSCLEDNETGADSGNLFLAVRSVPGRDGRTLYLVRPAPAPRCHLLYGAHSFDLWLVAGSTHEDREQYSVVLSCRVSSASVLDSLHNGLNDVATKCCTESACNGRTYIFDGNSYILQNWRD